MDNSYKINDNRNIKFFSKKTFCGLLITESFQNLKRYILKEPNFNKALFCALDLLSSGKCDKLMQTLIMIYCKNINTKNPSFPLLFYNRYAYFIRLREYYNDILKGDKSIELLYRNDQGIRNCITEMVFVLINGINGINGIKNKGNLSLPSIKTAPDKTVGILNFTEDYVQHGDSYEVSLALNEFINHHRNNEIKKGMIWISWLIQVEKLKLKKKEGIFIVPRNISGVMSKYCSDFLFLFWEYTINAAQKKDAQTLKQVQSLYSFYRYNFNPKSRKIYLLITAIQFTTDFYNVNKPITSDYHNLVKSIMSINLIIKQFKKYEKTVLEEELEKIKKPKTNLDKKLEMQNKIDLMLLQKTVTKI